MATGKTKTKKAKRRKPQEELSKAQVTKFAKQRREGVPWGVLEIAAGFEPHTSTPKDWAEAMERFGFDKYGRPGGKGESKARGWSAAQYKAVASRNGGPKGAKAKK